MSFHPCLPFADLFAVDVAESATQLFDALKSLSYDGIGITRECYSASEQAAIDLMQSEAARHGLQSESDAAGNLFITLPGSCPQGSYVLCGSHLDSVPHGGNYDGAAGVIAGLLCLCRMKELGVVPRKNIKLVVLRAEEGAWFGRPCIGSRALLGRLKPDDLMLCHYLTNETLAASMQKMGVAIELISQGHPLIDPREIAVYFELHIEQGPVLEASGQPLAIVSGVRGNIRHKRVTCTGQAGHSGTVPQSFRQDAVLAAADLLMRMEMHCRHLLLAGRDLVFTAGILHTDAGKSAITRIPDEVVFSLDIRSQDPQTLKDFYEHVLEESSRVASERTVSFTFDDRTSSRPTLLDARWTQRLQALAGELGFAAPVIPSGAGHDAAIFADEGIPAAMIFVRNENGSHNPNEAMEIADFIRAAQLLYRALLEAA
jgi:beta-ureidopropionase / N-carbamoyl-L-amino-acid hydrolase